MFRIAVFSDVHGNLEALEAILANMEKADFDEIVCLGDVIGLGPDSKACLDLIMRENIKLVLGNHERYYLNGTHNEMRMSEQEHQHHAWIHGQLGETYKPFLSKLDIDLAVTVDDKKVGFMHYPFDKVSDNFYPPKELTEENVIRMFRNYSYQFTFFGHSHQEQFFKAANDHVYINVGSVGCTKDDITHYTILEYDGKNYNIYRKKCFYDRNKFEEKLRKLDYPAKDYIMSTYF